MKHAIRALMGFGLILGFAASAQSQGYGQRDDPYYRNDRNRGGDDDYYRQRGDSRYGTRQGGSLIGQVLSDIDRAASNSAVDDHERRHFYEASRTLQDFEARLSQGNFDKGKLDKAIENLQHLADSDQVRGRDRDILTRDLSDLRQFRSSRGRYSNGGYRDYRDDRYYGR